MRTKRFAIVFVGASPNNNATNALGTGVLKFSTPIGTNYREANRAKSRKGLHSQIGIVEKEPSEDAG